MSYYEKFQESSTTTKVITIGVAILLTTIFFCSCGLFAWFFLFRGGFMGDIAGSGATATPLPPQPTATAAPVPDVFEGWRAEYYSNPELAGEPVLVRDEPRIELNLESGSPGEGVPAENFSARWTISREVPAGIYRFSGTFDNGYRLWVDDNLLVDQWAAGPVRTETTEVNLIAGTHSVQVEYFHTSGPIVAQFQTEYVQNFPDWRAEYFAQPDFNSPPLVVQNETEINYNWGTTSPVPGVIPDNNYAVRWTRTNEFEAGTYIFRIGVEGGVRLWLDGQILIDGWEQQPFRQLENVANLSAGGHSLRVEYWKESGNGQIRVGWAKLQAPDQPPVAVINGTRSALVGQTASFNARSSGVAEGSQLVSFDWDFGDGTTASGLDVSHVYNSPGVFGVTLVVVDDKGLSDSTVHEIQISAGETTPTPAPEQPPVVRITAPAAVQVGEPFTVDATGSQCATRCVSYAWNMGDGTQANAVTLQHVYQSVAVFNVFLTVTDDRGLQSTANQTISAEPGAPDPTNTPVAPVPTNTPVAPEPTATPEAPAPTDTPEAPAQPPAAVINGPAQGEVDEQLTFDGSGSQPGSGGPIVRYAWDFGDGNSADGPAVNHTYTTPGSYTVRLAVVDEQGESGVTESPVEISGASIEPPIEEGTPTPEP
jgi:PKD repeat protein